MFSVMVTYPKNRLGWGEVPSLGRPFWGQHIQILFQSNNPVCKGLHKDFNVCRAGAGEGSAKAWLLGA